MKKYKPISILILVFALVGCGASDSPLVGNIENEIEVYMPHINQHVSCPLNVYGKANGWYFEGFFPVRLVNNNGETIAQAKAYAQEDWTTPGFIDFEADLIYSSEPTEATLVLSKNNPSGLKENDKSLSIPVFTSECSPALIQEHNQLLVKEYIELNIGKISPTEPVLGGSWYVTKIEFNGDENATIVYEDGHIEETITVEYKFGPNGEIEVKVI